jgi:hypothetical protein
VIPLIYLLIFGEEKLKEQIAYVEENIEDFGDEDFFMFFYEYIKDCGYLHFCKFIYEISLNFQQIRTNVY